MNDDDRRRILERRARYVAMALAGVGTATQAACGPCLSPPDAFVARDASMAADAGVDASTSIDASEAENDAP